MCLGQGCLGAGLGAGSVAAGRRALQAVALALVEPARRAAGARPRPRGVSIGVGVVARHRLPLRHHRFFVGHFSPKSLIAMTCQAGSRRPYWTTLSLNSPSRTSMGCRSEERRVGEAGGRTCGSWVSPMKYKKKT